MRDKHWIGDDSSRKDATSPSGKSVAPSQPGTYNGLLTATRAHANFAENVPLAFILAGALGILFVLRVLHADFGVTMPGSLALRRPVG